MKILITGASGFVGIPILYRLINSHKISKIQALTRKIEHDLPKHEKVDWVEADIGDSVKTESILNEFKPDILIHLAWSGIPDFSEYQCLQNLRQSIDFINHVLQNSNCKKILVAGSCFEYNQMHGICHEDSITEPKDFFTWAKLALLKYLLLSCDKHNVSLAWFRLFYVYGARQREGSLFPTLCKVFEENSVPNLNTPKNANDFIHVNDVARAFELATSQEFSSGIYNLGRGKSVSVVEFCKALEMLIKKDDSLTKMLINNTSDSIEEINFYASTVKAEETFGWVAETSLESGLKESLRNHNE